MQLQIVAVMEVERTVGISIFDDTREPRSQDQEKSTSETNAVGV